MKKREKGRKKDFSSSLFYFPFFALAAAGVLAFFGYLSTGVAIIVFTLVATLIFRIVLKDKSPWKARSRATDCAILIFFAAVFLGSYFLLSF